MLSKINDGFKENQKKMDFLGGHLKFLAGILNFLVFFFTFFVYIVTGMFISSSMQM